MSQVLVGKARLVQHREIKQSDTAAVITNNCCAFMFIGGEWEKVRVCLTPDTCQGKDLLNIRLCNFRTLWYFGNSYIDLGGGG